MKGFDSITPDIFKLGFFSNRLRRVPPPMECPMTNKGKSFLTLESTEKKSSYKDLRVMVSLPPEE